MRIITALGLMLSLSACSLTDSLSGDRLKHTRWQLVAVDGVASLTSEPITIEFIDALQVSGFAGCNRYFGQVQAKAQRLQFSNLGMTRKLCDEASNNLEQQFLSLLNNGADASLTNANELTLSAQQSWLFRPL